MTLGLDTNDPFVAGRRISKSGESKALRTSMARGDEVCRAIALVCGLHVDWRSNWTYATETVEVMKAGGKNAGLDIHLVGHRLLKDVCAARLFVALVH